MDYVGTTSLYHGLMNSRQDHANTRLISTNKTTKKQEGCVLGNKSSGSPPWNSLGAKSKSKSFPCEMGGRAQHPEICDVTGWPALSSRQSASSTPVLSRTQLWTAADSCEREN